MLAINPRLNQNLSWRLPQKSADPYLDSRHIREVGSQDVNIWNYAEANGYVSVTKDLDFQQRSLLLGHSPKIVRLQNARIFVGFNR